MAGEQQKADAHADATRASRARPRASQARANAVSTRLPRARYYFKQALRIIFAITIVTVISTAAAFAYLYSHYSKVVDERLASGYLTSRAGVYAAPRVLRAGQRLTPEQLGATLRRAGYVEGEAGRVWSGKFKVEDDSVEIQPSEAREDDEASGPRVVRVSFDRRGRVASVAGDGSTLDSYTLDPEPLTSDSNEKSAERAALSYEEVPPVLRDAVLSIEDRRFFEHGPVDLWGVARALFSWDESGADFKQGGSTITQQLVKNTYLTPERTLQRKFREAALASVIESRIPKQDIFALYCNEIYLGRRGSVSVRGVRQAARVYFGKGLKDLSLAEAATIAGMIQSPGRYAPDRHPEESRARRNVVLGVMLRDGRVTQDEARAASNEPVGVTPDERTDATAPYFIDYVNRAVESRLPASVAEGGQGLRVYTTIDLELQQLAEEAIAKQTERLEKAFKGRRPQAALVALDPRTGRVLAMVGGNSYAESQLNRATDARRQPGSVFKPVVYAAAMEGGLSPLSLSTDAPREFTYDARARYRPANYGGGFSMRDVTLRTGLVRSLNVVTVDVALRAGLTRVATLAERLGLPKPAAYPSLALGTSEATPLEVATAYTAFAEEGRVVRPNPIFRVEGAGGRVVLQENVVAAEQVLRPATAYMLTDMLSAVIDHGTARAARGAFKDVAVAGKTGTSRDGWFAGYTPNLVCVVWVGFDDGSELNMMGADAALPVWSNFVRRATELRPELGGRSFDRPSSITTVDIDPETGQLASASCPQRERVALAPAFVPDHECSIHGDPWGLKALAESAAADSMQTAVETDARAPAEYDSQTPPRALYAANVVDEAPRKAYDHVDAEHYEPAPRPTRVETGGDGRRRLTNELRVSR
jgi:penicillin-binding protein 1B